MIDLDYPSQGWRRGKSLAQFVQGAFPDLTRDMAHGDDDNTKELIRSPLTARSLTKPAKVTFEPTDDIRNHLRFDVELGIERTFHHVGFLKEMLRATRDGKTAKQWQTT